VSSPLSEPVDKAAAEARACGRLLQKAPRSEILRRYASLLNEQAGNIFAANQLDLEREEDTNLKKRLKFDQSKLDSVLSGIETLAAMPEVLGTVELATKLDTGLVLERVRTPIGVLAIIFEARPDALPQIAALAIKSGNAALLKGGKEAGQTNALLFALLREALGAYAPAFHLFEGREAVEAMLKSKDIDLIIPRGSKELVTYIQKNTQIPVLGHADGICHIYIDDTYENASEEALALVLDAKLTYPAACNSLECLLLDKKLSAAFKLKLCQELVSNQVELRLTPSLYQLLESQSFFQPSLCKRALASDFGYEFGAAILAVEEVDGLDAAITHINTFGSGHTDALLSESPASFERFFQGVDSASVYHNCSTRFADGFRYGFGAEVGISTGRMPPRGPVGVEGLLTYKYRLRGAGHITAPYGKSKQFMHESISIN